MNENDTKYMPFLGPFLMLMNRELHANAGKGDRPGWMAMSGSDVLLEIYYHVAKLQKAIKDGDLPNVQQYAADVANLCMMATDILGVMPKLEDMAPDTTGFGRWMQLFARLQEAQAQSVTRIMLKVIPGEEGMGEEVYAKSVDEVENLLSTQGMRIEDLEGENLQLRGALGMAREALQGALTERGVNTETHVGTARSKA